MKWISILPLMLGIMFMHGLLAYSGDNEFIVTCGGDEELIIMCPTGDAELQNPSSRTPPGNYGFGTDIKEAEISFNNIFLYIIILFIILLLIMFIIILYYSRKRKNKKFE